MLPLALIPVIAQLAPLAARAIGNALSGQAGAEIGEKVGREVTGAATRIFGTTDEKQIEAAVAADPNKALEFKAEMERLATQAQLASVAADLENVKSARAALSSEAPLVRNAPVILSVIITLGFFGTLLSLIFGWGKGLSGQDQIVREVLALLLGALTLAFGDVRNFWLGSSAGSKRKDETLADQASKALQNQAEQTRYMVREIAAPAAQRALVSGVPASGSAPQPAPPDGFRRAFPGGLGWRTTPAGVLLEGEVEPRGTTGAPTTVRRIWRNFAPIILAVAEQSKVPPELIVATIATESHGDPTAMRTEGDGRQSVGLMQTLLGTAGEMLGREVTAAELTDPETSITAGALYIRRQRAQTEYEPPLVAAAYNAGGLRETGANRWRLVSTPEHLDRFCMFYNDAVRVAKEDQWFS